MREPPDGDDSLTATTRRGGFARLTQFGQGHTVRCGIRFGGLLGCGLLGGGFLRCRFCLRHGRTTRLVEAPIYRRPDGVQFKSGGPGVGLPNDSPRKPPNTSGVSPTPSRGRITTRPRHPDSSTSPSPARASALISTGTTFT